MADVLRLLKPLRRLDWISLGTMICLLGTGVVFIWSAGLGDSSGGSGLSRQWLKQLFFIGLGLPAYLVLAAFDYRRFRDWIPVVYGGSLALLVGVLFLGITIHGATSWYRIGGFTFQPSEVAKIGLILTTAAFLGDPLRNTRTPRTVLSTVGVALPPFLLILAQPDFGTAMILPCIVLSILFVSGLPWRLMGLILVLVLLSLPVAWTQLKDYQKERILVFFDTNHDPLDAGWNKKQSMLAVGSGGLDGKGIGQGTQNILGFLPTTVAPTDFIFSVIAEEKGFFGCTWLISLYSLLFICLARTALRSPDPFGRCIAVGILTMLFMHVTINIAMTIGLMPIVGLPLPFVSYGGSFVLSMMLALGLAQSVYARRD